MIDDEAIRVWHGRLGPSWRNAYRTFQLFYDEVLMGTGLFKGMFPSDLVEWQSQARGREAYRVKGLAQQWINGQRLRVKTKELRLSYISSFFLHNHAPFPPDPSFHFTSDVEPVEGCLTVEAFRRVLLNSNKLYRAVFLMMAHGMMGRGELVYVNTHHWSLVLQKISKKAGVFKVPLPGRKRSRNVKKYYTMLCTESDWGDAMRDYLMSLPHMPTGALFKNQRGKPITTHNIHLYFNARAVEAGIVKRFSPPCNKCHGETVHFKDWKLVKVGYKCKKCPNIDWADGKRFSYVRYGVNPHEMRDLMKSRWHVSKADLDVWEFMAQHEVDPNLYDKFMKLEPWYPVQEYRKALPWLNVLSCEPEKVDRGEIDSRLEERDAEIDALRRDLSDVKRKLALVHKGLEALEKPEVLEALLKQVKKKKGN